MKLSRNSMCDTMEGEAKRLGLQGIVANIGDDGSREEYVLFENGEPIYASSSAESIGTWLALYARSLRNT